MAQSIYEFYKEKTMEDKNIFNVYVVMESQEQCDRMKQVCVENGLPIWDFVCGWSFDGTYKGEHHFGFWDKEDFFIGLDASRNHIQATEAEFLQLLKEYKDV